MNSPTVPLGLLKIQTLLGLYNHLQMNLGQLTSDSLVLEDWCKENRVEIPAPCAFPSVGSLADHWDYYLGSMRGQSIRGQNLCPIGAAKMLHCLNDWLPPVPVQNPGS